MACSMTSLSWGPTTPALGSPTLRLRPSFVPLNRRGFPDPPQKTSLWNERVAELAALEILAQVRVDRAPTCADLGGSLGDQASAVLWKQDEAVRILDKGGDGAPALFDYVRVRRRSGRPWPAHRRSNGSGLRSSRRPAPTWDANSSRAIHWVWGCPVGRFDVAEHACSRRHVQDAQVAAQLRIRVGLGILNPFVDVVGVWR